MTDLEPWEAIAIAVGGLVVAWVVYDELCRLLGGRELAARASPCSRSSCLSAWAAGELLAPRAAYIEVGAMLGTIMAANVFFVIIPAHWELVRAKQDGREPDPKWNAPRQAAVGAQQLPHAAGRLRDALAATSRSPTGTRTRG